MAMQQLRNIITVICLLSIIKGITAPSRTTSERGVYFLNAAQQRGLIKCLLSPDVLFLEFPSEPLTNWSFACPIGEAIIHTDFFL